MFYYSYSSGVPERWRAWVVTRNRDDDDGRARVGEPRKPERAKWNSARQGLPRLRDSV